MISKDSVSSLDSTGSLLSDVAELRRLTALLERGQSELWAAVIGGTAVVSPEPPQMLSLSQAARRAGVGPNRVRRWCTEGLHHSVVNGRFQISSLSLDEWVASGARVS